MAVIFEFWQLSGLLNQLMDKARITEELRRARLSGFSVRFFDGVDWGSLFENSTQLRLFFSYGRTWRNSQQGQLVSFVAAAGRTLEVVLPNPDNAAVVAELSRRYEMTPDVLQANIRESIAFFEGLGRSGRARVVVYLFAKTPVYTFYRFDSRVVVALYRHRSGRGPIVTFTAERGGECYEWIESEWNAIMHEDPARDLVVAFDSQARQTN
jgi:hypothetical protein